MADVKWIKIVTDIFDDEKVRFIETMPNGDTIILIWFRLLCLCGKCNAGGFLMFTNKLAYTDEMLASIFNRDIKVIQMALKTFENLEMVEIVDNRLYIANWEKHQTLEKLEAKKLYDREYQRKKREEKKLLLENRTTIVRASNDNRSLDIEEDIDKEIDIDLDIEEEKEKKKKKETFVSIIDSYTEDEELRNALKDFVEMRKKKKGFTIKALKLNLNKLDKLANFEPLKIEIVNQSVENTWSSFYPLKNKAERTLPDWYTEKEEPKEEKEPTKEDHVQTLLNQYQYQLLLEEIGQGDEEKLNNLKEVYRGLTGRDIEEDYKNGAN